MWGIDMLTLSQLISLQHHGTFTIIYCTTHCYDNMIIYYEVKNVELIKFIEIRYLNNNFTIRDLKEHFTIFLLQTILKICVL